MIAAGRMLPLLPFGGRRAVRLIERNLFVYRRTWMVIFTGFVEPVFYLLGIGYGLGSFIGNIEGPGGRVISYAMFVAPALLATSAMNGAIYDSTNIFFKLRYQKTYDGILSTPISVGDVALGEASWALFRGALYAVGFTVVLFAFGLAASPLALLALPAAVLIAFATAAVGLFAVTFMRSWQDLDLITVVSLPLFLFSATFFPITAYPEPLRTIVEFTPLYRGVDLVRRLTTDTLSPSLIVDVVYLAIVGVVFLSLASRRMGKLLTK